MKRVLFLLALVFPLIGQGQSPNDLRSLAAASGSTVSPSSEERFEAFMDGFKSTRSTSDVALLKKAFHRTQKSFLDRYVAYSGFSEIFDGRYDCLTATAMFSLVLNRLQFDFHVVETNYHIFLVVKTSAGDVLLETTDRFDGFVTNPKDIEKRIGAYRKSITTGEADNVYHYSCNLYREVDADKLPGLLLFNQAVKAYNAGKLESCGELLIKSKAIYNTPRIDEFSSIFLKSVAGSALEESAKLRIIRKFKDNSRKDQVLALNY